MLIYYIAIYIFLYLYLLLGGSVFHIADVLLPLFDVWLPVLDLDGGTIMQNNCQLNPHNNSLWLLLVHYF